MAVAVEVGHHEKVIADSDPESAAHMLRQAQAALEERYRTYEDLAARDGSRFQATWEDV
jgi:pyruvate-ferredoxin/flavodoxin oxidoreductase